MPEFRRRLCAAASFALITMTAIPASAQVVPPANPLAQQPPAQQSPPTNPPPPAQQSPPTQQAPSALQFPPTQSNLPTQQIPPLYKAPPLGPTEQKRDDHEPKKGAFGDRFGMDIGIMKTPRDARRPIDSSWDSLEVSYSLRSVESSHTLLIPAVYFEISGTEGPEIDDGENDGVQVSQGRDFTGLGLSERARVPFSRGTFALTAGVSSGLYSLSTFHDYSGSDGTDNAYNDQFTLRLGYNLFAGISHRSGVCLEVRYSNAGELGGLGYRGTSFSIGFRH